MAKQSEIVAHEHKGPQCKTSDAGTVCQEASCLHDHHISRHTEVRCSPAEGKADTYNCVHEAKVTA
jgi:hypothetical protein